MSFLRADIMFGYEAFISSKSLVSFLSLKSISFVALVLKKLASDEWTEFMEVFFITNTLYFLPLTNSPNAYYFLDIILL
jgi:hypothetical protein